MIFHAPYRRTLALLCLVLSATLSICSAPPPQASAPQEFGSPLHWESSARLHRPVRPVAGTLILNQKGIEFRPVAGEPREWSFVEINTFDLTPRRLVLTSYDNNGWHRPGDRRYRFDLSLSLPPEIAERLAQLVGKPVINGDPSSQGEGFAVIPARHKTLGGGTNGTLRFSNAGIDYVTPHDRGARSWRWADIQTLACPDPYHFRIGGYSETFGFELKQPMSQSLFDKLWDLVYGRGLQLAATSNSGIDPIVANTQHRRNRGK